MLAAPFAALSFSARSAPLDPPTHAKRHRVHLREATVWASERASNVSKGLHSSACPCDDPALCEPVSGPPLRSKEIFGFGTGSPEPTDLDWSRVTTIAWAGANTTVTCLAHRHGVRIVLAAPSPESVFDKSAAIKAKWVADAVAAVTASHLDGIVFDWESPCPVGSPLQKAYAELVAATRAALRRLSPSYQVTICVAWSPDDIDGRGYDIPAFAAAADALCTPLCGSSRGPAGHTPGPATDSRVRALPRFGTRRHHGLRHALADLRRVHRRGQRAAAGHAARDEPVL